MKEKAIEKEFIKLYDRYSDAIFRYCYFRVWNRDQARDLTQETFAKTWHYLVQGGQLQNEKAFLYKVAANLTIDSWKKKKEISLEAIQDFGFDPGYDSRPSLENFIAGRQALEELDKLDDKYSQAIIMRYINGLSPKEIAEILGESENLISVRIHRGLKKLKELIAEDD